MGHDRELVEGLTSVRPHRHLAAALCLAIASLLVTVDLLCDKARACSWDTSHGQLFRGSRRWIAHVHYAAWWTDASHLRFSPVLKI